MEQKTPVELGLQILKHEKVESNNFRFISSELGFVSSFSRMENTLFEIGQPYKLQEGRVMVVTHGSAKISINLMEYLFQENNLSLIAPGTIVQIMEVSPDFDAEMIAVNINFLPIVDKEKFFSYYLQYDKTMLISLQQEEREQIDGFLSLIWNILQEEVFRKEVVQHLLASLLYNIRCLASNKKSDETYGMTHQNEIFRRFITLVTLYSKTERNVSFYAEKMCLTPRYLNTVIKQTSHQTIMDWINQSIIMEAKVLLKHSDKLVYQISDELNFPNPSFFCKFFKRITGITPQRYQKL